MTSDNPQKSSARVLFVLAAPMVVSFLASGWVAINAGRAYRESRCGIPVPWDKEFALRILEDYFPAAFNEVKILAEISSICISDLHAEVVSAYAIAFALSIMIWVVAVATFGNSAGNRRAVDRMEIYKGAGAAFSLSVLMISIVVLWINREHMINFYDEKRRINIVYDGKYINSLNYFFVIQGLELIFFFGMWWAAAGAALLWRCLGSKNKNKARG